MDGMCKRYLFICWKVIIAITFAACTNRDSASNEEVDTNSIYFDYKITGDEGSGEVTCLIQYHYDGAAGETLLLEEPSKVELDNEKIAVDSAQLSGAFYEIRKPLESFAGKHTITFTDLKGKKFTEVFHFAPFTLETNLEERIQRGEISLQLQGLKARDAVQVVLIDTSFTTDDINEIMPVQNGRLNLTKEKLNKVADGPVTLQLYKAKERKVKNATAKGGKISISYSLTRAFDLKQ
jgi:hypothetical protein